MADYASRIARPIPVLVGFDQAHVMAKAEIFRNPDSMMIQIIVTGKENMLLAEFLEQAEPIALSFVARPFENKIEKRENN